MKFKKLEVAGFKSFGDRLEVKFGAGVTAIVGPNGCGKSNVADSIRWVLGEQSAKLLRGNSMQDVIFNGTENRKSLSYCEVNLYFDNTNKQLFPSLDYDEVVISRKLYRSGESEYLLNRTACRLKDITDLLRDSGMGREGYSIIGQGRIEELLRSKPEDRRAIFEEAAGISKFKARKSDAERKLARTRENLVRIEDILHEKAALLEPLTKQSEAARKWLDLRDKLKTHEINIYIHQFDSASQAKEIIQERLNAASEEIELRQKDCDSATTQYNEAMESLGNADKSINALRDELLELTVGLEKAAGEIKVLQERLGYLHSQNERLKEEHGQLSNDREQLESFITLGETQIAEIAAALDAARIDAEKFDEEYLAVVDTLAQGEGEVESNHRAVMEAMDKLADIRANMSRMVAEREGLNAQIVDLDARLSVAKEKLETGLEHSKRLQTETNELVERKNELAATLDGLYETNNECVAAIGKAAEKIDGISAKYYMAKSRHKMLVEMQQSYEGFAYSVKKLLAEAKQRKDLSDKIEGVVASLIGVREGFETAIETALGNAVQNIVTRNEEDAKYLIEFLKTSRSGRATFLPISAVKPRSLDPE
ncbi:MAG: AAA family ATPase, partial [Clostridiales bacterium]|nr:AAA family ATPase [Clostridiales bacterium]